MIPNNSISYKFLIRQLQTDEEKIRQAYQIAAVKRIISPTLGDLRLILQNMGAVDEHLAFPEVE